MTWPRIRTFVGKLNQAGGTGGGPAPTQPTFTVSEVSASGQQFRVTANGGAQIDQATVSTSTITCIEVHGVPIQFTISNRTATSFDINTEETSGSNDYIYNIIAVKTPQGDTFVSTGIRFSLNNSNVIDFWEQFNL